MGVTGSLESSEMEKNSRADKEFRDSLCDCVKAEREFKSKSIPLRRSCSGCHASGGTGEVCAAQTHKMVVASQEAQAITVGPRGPPTLDYWLETTRRGSAETTKL